MEYAETRKQVEERVALEESILRARDQGDTATLARLQGEYRSRRYPNTRTHAGSSTTLRGSSTRSRHRVEAAAWRAYADRLKAIAAAGRARPAPRPRNTTPDVPVLPTVARTSSAVPIVFSSDAQYQIRNAPIDAGLERAGWLVGRFAGGGIVIETATVIRLAHSPYLTDSCRLPTEDRELWDRHFGKVGWRVCGDWHCHPQYRPEPEASEGDRRGWQVIADGRRHVWLGMIVGGCGDSERNGVDWRWPRYAGWLAHPGRTVLAPVHLTLSED
jgi:hypothetical protein